MHDRAYAGDAIVIQLAGSFVALLFASALWGAFHVVPRAGRATFMGLCCLVVIVGVLVQGCYTELGWQLIADAATLLNVFMFVEIAHAIRSRRSSIPLAIARQMCCRVARDGCDEPNHPALRAGRGSGVGQAV
jgi:hypothetical protein